MIYLMTGMNFDINQWNNSNKWKNKFTSSLIRELGISEIYDYKYAKDYNFNNYIIFFPELFKHPIQQFTMLKKIKKELEFKNLFIITSSVFVIEIIEELFSDDINYFFIEDHIDFFSFSETRSENMYFSFAKLLNLLENMKWNEDAEEFMERLNEEDYIEIIKNK